MGLIGTHLQEFSGAAVGKFYPGTSQEIKFHCAVNVRALPVGAYKDRWSINLTRVTGDWNGAPNGRIPGTPIWAGQMDAMVLVKISGILEVWLLAGDVVHRGQVQQIRIPWEQTADVTIGAWEPSKRTTEVLVEVKG